MDSDLIKKRLTEELTFLNGEVGRTKEIKLKLEKDIEDLELKKKTQEQEYLEAVSTFDLRRERQDNEVKSSEEKLDEFRLQISKIDKELEDKQGKLLDVNAQLEKSILANGDVFKRKQELEENIISAVKDLEKTKKDIISFEKELEAKKKIIKEKEDNVTIQSEAIVNQTKELEIRENKLSDIEKENKKIFELNAIRSSELDKQSEVLSVERQKFNLEKVDSVNRDNNLKNQLEEIKIKQDALVLKEKEIEKKENASILREQKSILKEEELRIREKRVSLKEQVV